MKDKEIRHFIRENIVINHLNVLKLYIRVLLLHGKIDSVSASNLILSIDKLMKSNKYLNQIMKLWLLSDSQNQYFDYIFEIIEAITNKEEYDEIEFPHNPSAFIQFLGHKNKKNERIIDLEDVFKFLKVNHISMIVGYLFFYRSINELIDTFKYTVEKYKTECVSLTSESGKTEEIEQVFILIHNSLKQLEKFDYLIPVTNSDLYKNHTKNFYEDLENSLFMSYSLKFKYVLTDSNIIFFFEMYKYLMNVERIIFLLISLQNVDKNFSHNIFALDFNQILDQTNFIKTIITKRNRELDDEIIFYTIKNIASTTKQILIRLRNINNVMARKVGLEPTT